MVARLWVRELRRAAVAWGFTAAGFILSMAGSCWAISWDMQSRQALNGQTICFFRLYLKPLDVRTFEMGAGWLLSSWVSAHCEEATQRPTYRGHTGPLDTIARLSTDRYVPPPESSVH